MVCPQTDKVDRSFSTGTTKPALPFVDFNRQPALSIRTGRRADYLPNCKGSVDFDRVFSPRLRGEHLSCDATTGDVQLLNFRPKPRHY